MTFSLTILLCVTSMELIIHKRHFNRRNQTNILYSY